MPVWGLTGQDVVIAQLRRAIERDRVPHAYLFSGPRGAPLYDAAIALAMAVSCQRTKGDPCGECDACAKIIAGIHPDVTTLVREGAAQIVPIESVRTQVIARLGLPPHEGPVRVFIVEEATSLAPPAANALLKTLEEPPARTLFVMCTTAPEQLLPTIRSRCQRVRFAGGAAVTASDPERAARITALAEELASDQPDSSLPARIAEGKGDCAPVLVAAAQQLHTRLHTAATRGDLGEAAGAAARASSILSWHTAVAIHNANPLLAIDALLAQLSQLPPVNP
ncbi:MAG TPA: DNA polymerase III subunit [Kofleriaceae bacterium]|nr:DNA polymerase III subunit [Kofleriaceae bacterium]